jgi:hypothetical protein
MMLHFLRNGSLAVSQNVQPFTLQAKLDPEPFSQQHDRRCKYHEWKRKHDRVRSDSAQF